ncbi:DUF4276 family protein [Anaeromyxobacter paludicola]|uniref:DUF4276 family protein n=1 Tax=Anaeromyxobacter paludicola TaxID=2918171 RepID=UPI0020C057B7|nr:DUF4276 family protein [Anaeromyxobacter paludicola]
MRLGIIVEGHGDESAAPVLIRRILGRERPALSVQLIPFRLARTRMLKSRELERAVDFLARRVGLEGSILVLLDADDDCPAILGDTLTNIARTARPDLRIAVVAAVREYEAWFLGSVLSLRGQRGLSTEAVPPADPESIRGAKEWLGARMQNGYSETLDQPAFSALLDLDLTGKLPSFGKLVREVCRLADRSA